MNISELKTAANQIPLVSPGLFALVVKVQPRKTGTGQYGDWSLQGLSLKDNSGEISAVIWGRPDLSALAGKEIHLSALNNGSGWTGCIVEDRTYKAQDGSMKSARQIKASGTFLLEECQPTAQPVGPGQPGYPQEQAAATPANGATHVSLPDWGQYCAVMRSAHHMAMEMEPDTQTDGNQTIDRSRARLALVATVLIAWGKKDFVFTTPDDDIPF